jgi:trehalose 6-phosphate phosphatase
MKRLARLARTDRLLVALDFDGTLAPIVPRPEMAEMLPGAEEVLRNLGRLPRTELAIITGRDFDDVSGRIPFRGSVWISGSHGRILAAPGEVPDATPCDPRLQALETLAVPDGVRIERKHSSIAFHWRGREGGEPADWTEQVREIAEVEGLEVLPGRMVLEVMAGRPSKEVALAEIARMSGATGVLYAGDDRTDVEAIRWARRRGVGVLVASEESRVGRPYGALTVDGPEGLVGLLERLHAWRRS